MCTYIKQILVIGDIMDERHDHTGHPIYVSNEQLHSVLNSGPRFYTQDALLRHRHLQGQLYVVAQTADGDCHLSSSHLVRATGLIHDIVDLNRREQAIADWLAAELDGVALSDRPIADLHIGHKAVTLSGSEYLLALPTYTDPTA